MSRPLTFAVYAVIASAVVARQVFAVRRGRLSLGQLAAWFAHRWLGRAVLVLGWAWLGWHLFARGGAAFLR